MSCPRGGATGRSGPARPRSSSASPSSNGNNAPRAGDDLVVLTAGYDHTIRYWISLGSATADANIQGAGERVSLRQAVPRGGWEPARDSSISIVIA